MPARIIDERADLPLHLLLIQTGPDRFTLVYGDRVKAGLNRVQAAKEYGFAILHGLSIAGQVVNDNAETIVV